MSVGFLLITHNKLGDVLLETALTNLDHPKINAKSVAISFECDPDKLKRHCQELISELNSGQGVLIITDLYGSTPSNIAHSFIGNDKTNDVEIRVVSGVNLPMLMRALNYANLGLSQLVEKAMSGGKDGIVTAAEN